MGGSGFNIYEQGAWVFSGMGMQQLHGMGAGHQKLGPELAFWIHVRKIFRVRTNRTVVCLRHCVLAMWSLTMSLCLKSGQLVWFELAQRGVPAQNYQ